MVRQESFIVAIIAMACSSVSAFVVPSSSTANRAFTKAPRLETTFLQESFGFKFADDPEANTLSEILGEANYKQYINSVSDNAFLNRQYNFLRRIGELNLLKLTGEYEILSKLEKNGLDLAKIEQLLPQLERLGLLSFVANNQQLLVNLAGPLLIEPAPLLIPVIAGALEVGPPAFYLSAATLAATEVYLVANNVEIPLVGLSAGVFLGLLLVPLSVVLGGLGVALSSLSKK